MTNPLRVALTGNPNCGKTTLFNNITGAHQHVGNYHGVTVEVREGRCRIGEQDFAIVDLPGTYALTAYSAEELVARRFLLEETPDVVVDVIDASNPERSLYLAVQLIELKLPLVLAFNMADVAAARGLTFDTDLLARLFGAPIVSTVGNKARGTAELLDAVASVADGRFDSPAPPIHYGAEIEAELAKITDAVAQAALQGDREARWFALKLLENDEAVRAAATPAIRAQADQASARLHALLGDSPEILIADRRYGFISGACQEAVRSSVEARHTMSDKIDAVLTHRILGLPIFLALMYLLFTATFKIGNIPVGWLDSGFRLLSDAVSSLWPAGSESLLRALLVEGVIGGVGGVLKFVPNIMILFLGIALLEDTGYMARAAFIVDHLMHKIGLHGKSFIPMLIGFGCSVPAIMATRTLETRRDRLTTMFVVPLLSCGARLPIYMLLVPAFFPTLWQGPVLFSIYLIGIVLAIGGAKLLRATVLRGEPQPFVMELPPYRMPTVRALAIHMWQRAWMYLCKAGTVLLAASVILWAMTVFPRKPHYDRDYKADVARQQVALESARAAHQPDAAAGCEAAIADLHQARAGEDLAYSLSGRIGRGMAPAIEPLGFDWRIGTALIGALAAKEVFVTQLSIIYAVGHADESPERLGRRLRGEYSPLQAYCIMLFCLISTPCVATMAVMRRESGSWRWMFFQIGALTATAYGLTLIVYQIGRFVTGAG
ncbi:MAG: ferrous iron transport protein B [Planctomycetota bacterium]|nr:ferrous iron transport protein B [Planctomycetota bacterium]